MESERIASVDLHQALTDAQRRQGWNFRDAPIRRATVGTCTVIVVPAKVWVYWRRAPCLLATQVLGNGAAASEPGNKKP